MRLSHCDTSALARDKSINGYAANPEPCFLITQRFSEARASAGVLPTPRANSNGSLSSPNRFHRTYPGIGWRLLCQPERPIPGKYGELAPTPYEAEKSTSMLAPAVTWIWRVVVTC